MKEYRPGDAESEQAYFKASRLYLLVGVISFLVVTLVLVFLIWRGILA